MTAIRRLAHDSGDGQTVMHCPFCGGGQVIGRSDGTIECEFDGTAFTVQVQPLYSGFPQTVNGMPFPIPGMPGQIGPPPMPPGPPGAGAPPGAVGDGGEDPFAQDAGQDAEDPAGDAPPWADSDPGDDADPDTGQPPPAPPKGKSKKSGLLRTASGARLSETAYAEYLAVRHATMGERAELLERLRLGRGGGRSSP